jgi:hypothetical protein
LVINESCENVIEGIITSQIESVLPRFTADEVLRVEFYCSIDYEKYEGYNRLHLYFYRPNNYTKVLAQREVDLVKREWIKYDEDDEEYTTQEYIHEKGEFRLLADHDSCWTSAIGDFLRDYKNEILGIESPIGTWYKIEDKPFEYIKREYSNIRTKPKFDINFWR